MSTGRADSADNTPSTDDTDSTVKCVVWDLDGTVWPDVAIERPGEALPDPTPAVLELMDALEARGIVNCVASRTDPSLLPALIAHPALAGRIVLWRVGWSDKSASVTEIAEELGIDVSAIALVDDSAFERAEVAGRLPGVLTLDPTEFTARIDTAAFCPAVVTEDARRRPQRYREHVTRFAAEAHATADRRDFLRESGIELEITRADAGSCERMSELIIRSHRLNSTGEAWTPDHLRAIVDDPRWLVTAATLTDRFGDYGLIATMLVDRGDPAGWRLRSLTTSCRAAGRAVPTALLAWAVARAQAEAVDVLLVDVVARPENLQLRVLLRSAGFGATARATAGAAAGAVAGAVAERAQNALVLSRATTPPIDVPDWLHVRTPDRAGA